LVAALVFVAAEAPAAIHQALGEDVFVGYFQIEMTAVGIILRAAESLLVHYLFFK